MTRLTAVSLFSGCGGSDLGATRAGAEIIFANDNARWAAESYRQNAEIITGGPGDFVEGDVRNLRSFPKADLAIGCYPCQSFTMGGPRNPRGDPLTDLYREFVRCLNTSQPRFFVAENVPGLRWLDGGKYFFDQLEALGRAGRGYLLTHAILNARDFGVPADRKRLFIVGVRRDLGIRYVFPSPTHGVENVSFASQDDAIGHLPLAADGEYYDYRTPSQSWWYMSRNRRREWDQPSYTIVGNWRHVPLHPASPPMKLVRSDLANGSRQDWEFAVTHDREPEGTRPRLEEPRRLSWRECALLQSFPRDFTPQGPVAAKFQQIGNAVPPKMMEAIVAGLVTERALVEERGNQPAS